MMKDIIGIDPGKNGGIAWKDNAILMPATPEDLYNLLDSIKTENCICYLEKVGGMPGQGGSAMFNFGKGYGNIEMALIALKIPCMIVTPQKWQKELQLGTRGTMTKVEWKNKLKARAQQLFPNKKITLAISDALLIYYYGTRKEK